VRFAVRCSVVGTALAWLIAVRCGPAQCDDYLPAPGKLDNQPALKRPLELDWRPPAPFVEAFPALYQAPFDAPLGFTGPSGVLPREEQSDPHFVPVEDRWRIGFPDWQRYEKGAGPDADAPYQYGQCCDPYNQNVLKGDYPILGQHTFFVLTATSETLVEPRQVPVQATVFESTSRPGEFDLFGRPGQFLAEQFFSLSFELFHGNADFRPVDWRVRLTPVFNINYVDFDELGVVNPSVLHGPARGRTFTSLEEFFVETKLADLSSEYDFLSVRVGSQPFVSDFRGFIFSDTNLGARAFGNLNGNREQFNLAVFDQFDKDTDSQLNSFRFKQQQVAIANLYVQDFVFPGYTAQWSVLYNHDRQNFHFDTNGFLVRPDPVGVFTPHTIDVAYLGWNGDGHINSININHAAYWAVGHDSLNPIANQPQDISAFMAALELSYDRDWTRFRVSAFYASGDDNPNNHHATGFDAILDNPNFAGGEFSYWQRQTIPLFGVNLTNRESLLPDLRTSKTQGQSNFVNPGLLLLNTGVDFELTPKLRLINNVNFLWFDSVEVLRTFTFAQHIDNFIGVDLSLGIEYRPLLSNNIIVTAGLSCLLTGTGFRDLYGDSNSSPYALVAGFVDLILRY
jgi:hypothetical protein